MKDLKFRAWNRIVERFQFFDLKDIEKQKGQIQWDLLEIDLYTGLRDSKGRKIFENDIIEFSCTRYYDSDPREPITKTFVSQVKYIDAAFIISETQEDDTFLCAMNEECVIKGNIYQNKHLLKEFEIQK
ncbi:YopX family protein [Salinimicrobium sp. GXAS 041]|uniref:YopX family protein n=1 Tax=Salinimicrobium sp. GXAS 041 TaxID=3400806 RepID=UPI003C7852BF